MTSSANAVRAANEMIAQGQAESAAALLKPIAEGGDRDLGLLTALGLALKTAGSLKAALAVYRDAAAAWPASSIAHHNLAGALGDAERFEDSESEARLALQLNLNVPETWLVLARALQGQARFKDATVAYHEALLRRPAYADAHGDLANLIWMRTGDLAQAREALDVALANWPGHPALSLKLSKLLDYAGDTEGAYGVLSDALKRNPREALLHIPAAHLATRFNPVRALGHAESAIHSAPGHEAVLPTLAQARLAAGQPDGAEAAAIAFLDRAPDDQYGIALLTTAWRLMGDRRYATLHDYDHLIGRSMIDTPPGWSTLDAYLADLAVALSRLHGFEAHPVGQSLRQGTQTQRSLNMSEDPAIRAFFQAIDGPIRRHIASLGAGNDPARRRATDRYAFDGAWSARLRPGGFHVNHTHPKGWFSSACHIVLPKSVEVEPEGWLAFGEPGVPTSVALPPDHREKPRPGQLILFPSYMWHGTVPFSGSEDRLTVAFDIVPDLERDD